MAAPLKPQKVTANKKDSWWFAPAVASMAAPTVAEVNAAGGLNFTCYLLSDQDNLTSTTNKAQLPRLLCEDKTTEVIENVVVSMADLQSVFDPQAATGTTGKKTWDLFGKDGASGYLIRRQGVLNDVDSAVDAGEFVDVFKVDIAEGIPNKTATDATGLYSFTCGVSISDSEMNVAVVA